MYSIDTLEIDYDDIIEDPEEEDFEKQGFR